jgi:hypothetical protein
MIFDEIDPRACRRWRVPDALAHPQMVVLKHLVPASLLGVVMLPNRPPPHHGFLVAPGCVRQDPAQPAGALEAFVVEETVYLFEDWLQAFGEVEIEIELLLRGMTSKITENIAVASDYQSSCPTSGRSVSPSADRVPGTTTPPVYSIGR